MFHKTSTKLAGLYLAVLMAISLFFSINVYQLSVQEFDRGFRKQDSILRDGPDFRPGPLLRNQLMQEQKSRYEEAKSRVLNRLVLVNVAILLGGGFVSYFLARRTLRPIEEAHAALERFTADASHELRTPIAAMQTETEVTLMNPKLTLSQAKDQLKSNLEELAKLTSLSEGLLRLAQLENNDLQHKTLGIETLVTEAIQTVAPRAEKKHIQINKQIEPGLKTTGDEAALMEALVIILDNAIKYSPDKSEMKVLVQKDQNQVIIRIKDQGRGIVPTDLPHVFDRFYRSDSSRTKQTEPGYGLGLSIAKNIINLHKGALSVSSKQGIGSTFSVCLPLIT
ncbi:MAG TPA: HAMP domain-containing sensor histidine kinase [Candidatus Limnocylindrales bacterium]|nr:HAMP domain-containing sensor histidine kinase [Candidatus Limnocylindrales bacterium]